MTTLSKEAAIRAVLDGKTVEHRIMSGVDGKLETMWAPVAGMTKMIVISYIADCASYVEFRIKPEPVVRYILGHWIGGGFATYERAKRFHMETKEGDGKVLRVEAYPDGSYKIERVEE